MGNTTQKLQNLEKKLDKQLEKVDLELLETYEKMSP